MCKRNTQTIRSVGRVLKRIHEKETDSDHVRTIESALDRLWEIHGDVLSVSTDNLNSRDVEVAFEFLQEYGPSRSERTKYREENGESHPDAMLSRTFESFIDREERYSDGWIPSFRTWHIEYVRDGEVIEERTYDHDDEIPTEPVINGLRYECDRTNRGDGQVTVHVSPHPIREDVDLVVNASGDGFINLESHNGPNISDPEEPIDILSEAFNWGMLGDKKIIISDDPSNVLDSIERQGWN